jgi:hypothetical protein
MSKLFQPLCHKHNAIPVVSCESVLCKIMVYCHIHVNHPAVIKCLPCIVYMIIEKRSIIKHR